MASSGQLRSRAAVPTTVAQIVSCKQPRFRIFDIPIQTVCLVGVIRNMIINSCEVTCSIQDHSGTIKSVMRSETESEVATRTQGIKANKYAQVFGSVRIEDGEKVVLILKMFPVNDLNVITHHLLEFYCFTLEAEEEWKKQLETANTSAAALADSLASSEEAVGSTSKPHFTELQKLVFDIVRSEFSEEGMTRGNTLRQFPSYQGHEVNQALEVLINEGIIYHSVDQEHFKAANY